MLRIACITVLCIVASGFMVNAPSGQMLRLRQRSACSVSDMKVVEKKEGAKLKAKSIDFDFSNPTKLVGVEKEQSERIAPPSIETECGADYVPLLTALQLEKWEAADQLTRDMLIWIGGEGTRERNFVYFAEAKGLPMKDMKTIDDLWTVYSKGKFGYSVQKKIWLSKKVNGDFNKFVTEINWNKAPGASGDTGILRRWVPMGNKGNEFVYDLNKAKKGHLPLTSALRGVYLLKSLLQHPAFGNEGSEVPETGSRPQSKYLTPTPRGSQTKTRLGTRRPPPSVN
mmetsp:Transcript_56472/g.82865  ORF Transcript_56472/g.82865 Transcript_56472/m.82865 type:complete len:284 (+) Transcript_56472:14-865(+)